MNEVMGINWFQKQMLLLYSASFLDDKDGKKKDLWKERCVALLYNPKVDYQKFFDLVSAQNPKGNYMPDFPWLIEISKQCYIKEKNKSPYIHVVVRDPIYGRTHICVNTGTTQEQLIKALCKERPNTKAADWIIEDWRA